MDNSIDFFARFSRPMVGVRRDAQPTASLSNVRIVMDEVAEQGFRLRICDSAGKPIAATPRDFSGQMAEFVRFYNNLTGLGFGSVDWGKSASGGLFLNDNAVSLTMVRGLNCLYNAAGEPLEFSDATCRLYFDVAKIDDPEAKRPMMKGRLTLMVDGEEPAEAPSFVAPTWALCGRTLYNIPDMGCNFLNIKPLLEPFGEDDVAMMLSVFMSFFSNVKPRVEGYKFRGSDVNEAYAPTLVIERIDSDNSLYLRLTQTCRSVPDSAATMGLTYIVRRDDDLLSGHAVELIDLKPWNAELSERFNRAAPSRAAARQVYADGNYFILPEEVAAPFLFNHLPALLKEFRLIGVDKLKSYKVKPVAPKLKVKLSSGIDFLEGEATVEIGDQTFTLADLLKQYSQTNYVQLADGDRAVIDPEYMKRLERIYRHNRGKKGEFKVSFFDLPEIDALLDEKVNGKGLQACRDVYAGFGKLPNQRLSVPGLKGTLRPYQKEGVKWINYLYQNNLGGCLADDMGLGKTIQTISMLLKIYPKEQKPSLIVMPRSLLFNWEREIKRFGPSLTQATYYGTDRNLDEALKNQVVLTTYAMIRNDVEKLKDVEFAYVILDESQNIKNTDAMVSRAAWLLKGNHRLAISGTPIENNLTELYSLFRFLNPTMFGSLEDFNSTYTYPIQRNDDAMAAAGLKRKIYPFILRRLKRDVLKDLPDLIDQKIEVAREPEQAAFYERRRAYYQDALKKKISADGIGKSQAMMFQALNELRQIASIPENISDGKVESSKMPLLIEKLSALTANGHKTVVFFNYLAGLEKAAEELRRLNIDFETLTGATTNREKVVDRFVKDPDCMVFLMTLKTGGTGLNLTVADTVIIYEPWWNSAAEQQGINRLHRIGQTKKVMSLSLYTRKTIEDKIRELQEKKSLLVDDIISTDSSAFKHLSEEDIDFILS